MGAAILYKENCSSSDTSVIVPGTFANSYFWVEEFAGGLTSGLSDANGQAEDTSNLSTASTSCSTGTTGTLSQADGLALAFAVIDGSTNSAGGSWSGSFAEIAFARRSSDVGAARIAAATVSSTTAISATYSGFTSDQNYGAMLVLYAAGGGDVTAPVLSSGTATETGSTTATLGATTDEGNGTLYWVVTTSATEPSAAQIKLGDDHADVDAAFAGSDAVGSTGAKTKNATGLTASTAYYAYAMHEDAAANQSDVLYLGTFTTDAANAAPSWSGTPSAMSSKRGQAYTPQDITSLVSDADTLSYSMTGAPTGVTINSSTGVISGTPTAAPGVYACTVEADDGVNSPVSSSSFNITVVQASLALSAAGYEFCDGNAPATMAAENAVAWEIAVVPDELPVTTTLYHSASSTTNSTGSHSDIDDDDFSYGTTYVVQARRLSDGEWVAFTIEAT